MIYLNWNWACSESTLKMFRKWKIWGQFMHPRNNWMEAYDQQWISCKDALD